jgi:hypothetical protein
MQHTRYSLDWRGELHVLRQMKGRWGQYIGFTDKIRIGRASFRDHAAQDSLCNAQPGQVKLALAAAI